MNPGDTAVLIIEKVSSRSCTTKGQWFDLCYQIARLPSKSLQEWVWDRLAEYLPSEGIDYLKSWSSSIEPTRCRKVQV